MLKKSLKRVAEKAGRLTGIGAKQAMAELHVPDKLDELLHHVNRLKNASTVRTGDYEALTQLFTGQKMYVDTRDISVAPHLMLDGHWEPEITTIFRQHITPSAIVFDIGANFGYFGLVAGTHVGSSGEIHFFEANPNLQRYIFKTLAINGLLPVSHIVSKAVTNKPGTVELSILDDFWGSSGIGVDDNSLKNVAGVDITIHEKIKVPSITIDDYVKKRGIKSVDVIKIDIEGHEEMAYKGMHKTIKNSPNLKMFIEFTNDEYKDAKKFFNTINEDFGHVYAILSEAGGTLKKIGTYSALQKLMNDQWIMLVASKKAIKTEVA